MNLNNLWMVVAVAALLSLFFGYGFGWFEWGRKLKAYEADEGQKTAEEKKEPAPPRPIQQEEPALLVLRNIKGRLRLELEGHPLEADSLSAEQRKRLIDVVSRLRPWIDPRPASAPTPVPVPAPKTIPAAVAPPPQPVSVPVKKEEAQAPQSMVAQINEILQKNMLGTPLEKMGIKLAETPGGGVTVTVGLNRYESIGEVPSLEIQTAIRVAISEWEKKYTPG
jgi:hypothetical protein